MLIVAETLEKILVFLGEFLAKPAWKARPIVYETQKAAHPFVGDARLWV